MAYKNSKGESEYLFGWLEAKPGSKEFKPTTGGNSVWAKTKREAIAKVNRERKEFEKRRREEREAKLLATQQPAPTQLATQNSSVVAEQGDK